MIPDWLLACILLLMFLQGFMLGRVTVLKSWDWLPRWGRNPLAERERAIRQLFTPCHIEHGSTNPVPTHPEGLCASCDSIYAWRRRGLVEQEIREGFERRGA